MKFIDEIKEWSLASLISERNVLEDTHKYNVGKQSLLMLSAINKEIDLRRK